MKHSSPPPQTQKGSALLTVVMIAAILTGIIGISTAKISQASINNILSTKIAIQAQQYAEAESFLLKNTNYDDLVGHAKTNIPADTNFKSEVTLSDESDYNDKIKQRTATINIYKDDEANPRFTLKQIAYSIAQSNSGVPVGTIITWASKNLPKDGTWLECNGQSCVAYPELVAVLGKNTVPDCRNRFLEGDDSNNVGVYKEAGLPNITGQFNNVMNINVFSGAFYAKRSDQYTKRWEDWNGTLVGFDASRSNAIYGKSETVQPSSFVVKYLIKAN